MVLVLTKFIIRNCLLVLLWVLINIPTSHGQSTIESLLISIKKMKIDSQHVDSLNELAYLHSREDPAKVLEFAQQALNMATELNYQKGIGDGHVRLGIHAMSKGDYRQAVKYFDTAMKIRKQYSNLTDIASTYNNIGICAIFLDNFEAAKNNFNKGLDELRGQEILPIKGRLFNSLMDMYTNAGDYTEALKYADSSFQVYEKLSDLPGTARLTMSRGNLHFNLRNWSAAQKNYENSLFLFNMIPNDTKGIAISNLNLGNVYFELLEFDKSLTYYQECLRNIKSLEEFDRGIVFFNVGIIYKSKRNFKNALNYFSQSENIFKRINQTWMLASVNYELGNINFDQSNFSKSKDYYLSSLNYSETDFDPYARVDIYYNLSQTYSKINLKDSAFHFSQLHNLLRDSIYYNRIDAINYQLNLEESQKEKAQLKLQLSELNRKNFRNFGFLILFLLTTIITSLGVLFLRKKQEKKEAEYQLHLAEEEVVLANREVDDLLQNQELKMAYAKLEAKDETQKKIGQDLHDGIGVTLSTIKLYFTDFSNQLKKFKVDSGERQFKAIELLDEAVNEVRRISHDMQSGVLKKFGLAQAVKDLADSIRDSGQIAVEVQIHGLKERIPNQTELKIYKVIKELIANVLKHAKAKKLTLYLQRHDDSLNLIVEDDGIGFDTNKLSDKAGMGLKNIAIRVTELEGKFHFDSYSQKGTSVVIDIPIKNKSK